MKYLWFWLLVFCVLEQNLFAQKKSIISKYKTSNLQKITIDDSIVTFIGVERLKIIQEADSAFVYILNPDDSVSHLPSEVLEGFTIMKKAQQLNKPQILALQHQIIKANTYDFSGVYQLCTFSPGVAFEFFSQAKAVRLLLCFQCNNLMFFDANGRRAGMSFKKASNEWQLLVNRIINPKINKRR
jgi:hypothetical protein